MTREFERESGKGGSGVVYYGCLKDSTEAAVKMLYLMPPILHRDVKTPSILLNENLQSKIADFGLPKIFPHENRPYVSTTVIGRAGYLDPDPMIERGNIWSIADEKLQELHNSKSVWRSTDIAMSCVRLTSAKRPSMSQIVIELKECLPMEMDTGNS
ncbi:hypothetical protein Cgig2_000936 [Carnegiea gigantea]|uniref:Protein kinase domain-containing protein n=1 Tax=Carnegiea gigantea TaxID=171969 RepID=A0A9Q1KNP2_9CARY|nr:hypothetical protein Cgig2_000936 [Carnegiea gigantea]